MEFEKNSWVKLNLLRQCKDIKLSKLILEFQDSMPGKDCVSVVVGVGKQIYLQVVTIGQ